jgi:hypothetical protein
MTTIIRKEIKNFFTNAIFSFVDIKLMEKLPLHCVQDFSKNLKPISVYKKMSIFVFCLYLKNEASYANFDPNSPP